MGDSAGEFVAKVVDVYLVPLDTGDPREGRLVPLWFPGAHSITFCTNLFLQQETNRWITALVLD